MRFARETRIPQLARYHCLARQDRSRELILPNSRRRTLSTSIIAVFNPTRRCGPVAWVRTQRGVPRSRLPYGAPPARCPPPLANSESGVCAGLAECGHGLGKGTYTKPYIYIYTATAIRHGTCTAVSSGVASMTDRLRPKPSASIYPDRVSGNRTHALSVWTYVTARRCGVHAMREGSVRSGRHWSQKRAQSAPSRRLSHTAESGSERAQMAKATQHSAGPHLVGIALGRCPACMSRFVITLTTLQPPS